MYFALIINESGSCNPELIAVNQAIETIRFFAGSAYYLNSPHMHYELVATKFLHLNLGTLSTALWTPADLCLRERGTVCSYPSPFFFLIRYRNPLCRGKLIYLFPFSFTSMNPWKLYNETYIRTPLQRRKLMRTNRYDFAVPSFLIGRFILSFIFFFIFFYFLKKMCQSNNQ